MQKNDTKYGRKRKYGETVKTDLLLSYKQKRVFNSNFWVESSLSFDTNLKIKNNFEFESTLKIKNDFEFKFESKLKIKNDFEFEFESKLEIQVVLSWVDPFRFLK